MGPGRLVLKGGEVLGGVKKKKAKVAKETVEDEDASKALEESPADPTKPKPIAPTAVNVMTGKAYEEEFEFETQRMKTGKQRSTPWGSTIRQAPPILHGYDKPVTGKTAEERLDMRASTKSDKFCK